jgi:hypothetical protein
LAITGRAAPGDQPCRVAQVLAGGVARGYLKPKNAMTPRWTKELWPHNLNQMVAGKTGQFTSVSMLSFS